MEFGWNRDIVLSLIEMYGQNECLYNVESKDFMNREVKTAALNSILEELKKKNPAITMHALRRKLMGLRSQFSNEVKTMESKKRSMGAVAYVPRLWCFEQLSFLTKAKKDNTTSKLTEEIGKKLKRKRPVIDELQELQSILEKRSNSRKSKYNWLAKKVIAVLDEIEDNEDQAKAVLEIEGVLNWWQNTTVNKHNDDLSQHSTSSASNTMPFTEYIKVESPKLDI